MSQRLLRVHQLLPASQANGPGTRAVIWLQGCTLACPACFNPQTHPRQAGRGMTTGRLMSWLASLAGAIDGLTVSGGEPLQQMQPLLDLLQGVHDSLGLPVILFTGYTWQEIQAMPQSPRLARLVDVILAGRYQAENRLASGLLGSANKTAHFLTGVYTQADLDAVPPAEVLIQPDGEMVLSGINPLIWP